jgi:hypothetical protein
MLAAVNVVAFRRGQWGVAEAPTHPTGFDLIHIYVHGSEPSPRPVLKHTLINIEKQVHSSTEHRQRGYFWVVFVALHSDLRTRSWNTNTHE